MSGENPMLAKRAGERRERHGDRCDDSDRRWRGGAARWSTAKDAAGKGFPRGRGAQLPGFGRPVNLQGLAQVVGLALGAPEFQRR